ncbi:HNH homing endonuclease [Xanthomonas phage vB_XooS_NR08]|nr:HNH homing endonuclease [Xanthomonas phage vB_XooS_NR08]
MKKVFKSRDDITVADVLDRYHYDPETGVFLHARSRQGAKAGTAAGGDMLGYKVLSFSGHLCLAHRVAWLLVHGKWPENDLDHVDGDRSNNRISNLRECSQAENSQNKGKYSNNTSGVTGVTWNKQCQKWHAQLMVAGNQIFLGLFSTIEEAAQARAAAKAKYHTFNPVDRQ